MNDVQGCLANGVEKEVQILLQKCKSKFKDLTKYRDRQNKGKHWQGFYKMDKSDEMYVFQQLTCGVSSLQVS